MTILALHEQFCADKITFENLSPYTIKWHKAIFRSFHTFSDIGSIEELHRSVVENWIRWGRTERNWSPKTVRSSLMSLSVFLNWCVKESIIETNPTKEIKKPRLPKKIPKHLTVAQAEKLLQWAQAYPYHYDFEKNRAVAILAMFMYSGVRYQELVNLKFTDVDLTYHTIRVISGKGDKDRLIPLCHNLEGYLLPYLKERENINPYSPFFFVSKTLRGRMSDNVIKRLFAKLEQKTKMHIHPHMLRHTFATLMLEGGCDIFSLSKMMGHSDIKTTSIYLTATVQHLQQQINKHPLQ